MASSSTDNIKYYAPEYEMLYKQSFEAFDEGDGTIQGISFEHIIHSMNIPFPFQFARRVKKQNSIKNNTALSYSQFVSLIDPKQRGSEKWNQLIAAFRVYDLDGSNRISSEKIREICASQDMPEEATQQLIDLTKIDDSDSINYIRLTDILTWEL